MILETIYILILSPFLYYGTQSLNLVAYGVDICVQSLQSE